MGERKIPEKGSTDFKQTIPDETYSLEYEFHFKSQDNADKFAKNVSKYLPGAGGYRALAVEGHGAPCPEPPCSGGLWYGCIDSV